MGRQSVKYLGFGVFVGVLVLAAVAGFAAPAPSADEIMRSNFLTSKVLDSTSEATFRLITRSGQERVRDTESKTKLIEGTTDNMRVVVFLSPSDIRGTKTLLVEHSGKDDDIWIYLPAMKKVRRLVSNNKKDSFVGTDFSYGDVIGQKVEDWDHKLLREEAVDRRPCYVIESTPRRASVRDDSGYSKRVNWIDKESAVAVRGEIYDLGGGLLKKLTAQKVQSVEPANGKWQPMTITAENVQTGHKTIIDFKQFKADVGVASDVFTSRYLEQ
jgi:hypothetical protein